MLIKRAIKILLLGDAGIAALVGTRIFPLRVPQKGEFPAIAWGRTDREADITVDGVTGSRHIKDWFEFISFAQGAGGEATSEDIDDAVFELLHGKRATVTNDDDPTDTLEIQGIFHEKLSEHYRDDLQQYATRSIYRVHFVRKSRS